MLNYSRPGPTAFPSICEASLRRALVKELEPARRMWWNAQAERAANSGEFFPERYFPQGLQYGIWQLDQFGAAEDTGLFTAFLDHPAGSFNSDTDGSSTRFFTARKAAKAALQGRHIPLVTEVVTEIKFAPSEKIKVPAYPEKATGWRASAGLYGLLATACLVVWFHHRRSRTSTSS